MTTSGAVREIRAEWGESVIPNGITDSRDLTIEVRPTSTNCSPDQPWLLEVEGNWI